MVRKGRRMSLPAKRERTTLWSVCWMRACEICGVIKRTGRIEIDDIPGAGAAGGLGGGFVAFLKAELKPGIQMVLDALRLMNVYGGRI